MNASFALCLSLIGTVIHTNEKKHLIPDFSICLGLIATIVRAHEGTKRIGTERLKKKEKEKKRRGKVRKGIFAKNQQSQIRMASSTEF